MNKYWWIWLLVAILNLLMSLILAYFFYEFYWQWRDLFAENGRYFHAAESAVYTNDAKFYALPALFFLYISLELFKRLIEDLRQT